MGRGREGKKSKSPNKTPSRTKYWALNMLEKHKIRNMIQSCGLTEAKARREWRSNRKTRTRVGLT